MLKLSDIRTPIPFNMNRGTSVFTMRDVLAHEYEFDFDVFLPSKNMNLQRPLVWTLKQKQELIISLLKGIEISTVALILYDRKIYRVIDGKQRLTTWISFVKDEFPIVWEGKEYFNKDLDKEAKWVTMHSYVKADVAFEYKDQLISDDWKIKWFDLINFAGTPQDVKHMEKLKGATNAQV